MIFYAVVYRYRTDPTSVWEFAQLRSIENTYRSYPQIDTDRQAQEAYASTMMQMEPNIEVRVVEFVIAFPNP